MSTPDLQQLSALQKANTELVATLLRAAFNGVERLSALNVNVTRDFLNAAVNNAQQVLSVKSPGELTKLNSSLAQPTLEKWMEYSRNVYDLAGSVQKEITAALQGQYADFTKNATARLDQAKAAPGGDIFAAIVKSVLDASNRSFEQASAFTKQAASIAEANLQAATATAQAAANVSKSKK
ncbi:MAG: phasin family protein [Zoogloeaceae bacterium]|jgi:phasin family protein|nr:phasin family protein [Zoogloeaceae bacterium]